MTINEAFQKWYDKHHSSTEVDDEFSYSCLREAFEEGYHLAQDEARTKTIEILEELKIFRGTALITKIEQLKTLVKDRMYELEEISELKNLVTRAADTLEQHQMITGEIITKLREVAQ